MEIDISEQPIKVGTPYILIVDDLAFVRRVLSEMVKTLGFRVQAVESALEAIQCIQHHPPQLILLDLMMPKYSGLKVCEFVRAQEQTKDLPIIICTAFHDGKNIRSAIKAGATDVLCKPVKKEQLEERLQRHLSLKSAPAE